VKRQLSLYSTEPRGPKPQITIAADNKSYGRGLLCLVSPWVAQLFPWLARTAIRQWPTHRTQAWNDSSSYCTGPPILRKRPHRTRKRKGGLSCHDRWWLAQVSSPDWRQLSWNILFSL